LTVAAGDLPWPSTAPTPAENKKCSGFDFIADEFGQAHVIRFQALEEKQDRIVSAPFQFVADSADLLLVAVQINVAAH